jgi:hypothetical protein
MTFEYSSVRGRRKNKKVNFTFGRSACKLVNKKDEKPQIANTSKKSYNKPHQINERCVSAIIGEPCN